MGATLPEIKTKGWLALVKELGYAGATKFILLEDIFYLISSFFVIKKGDHGRGI
ncbi:MAG: hypothetical protein WA240_07145 [Nitrospirota bacterium]